MTGKLAEVIAATSTAFTAHCYRLYEAPPLGTLVRAGESPCVYGVVANVASGPLDPGRRVLPRGEAEDSEDAVYRQSPQLAYLLATTFETLIVGWEDGGEVRQGLPPLPPRVHSFVSVCTSEDLGRFSRSFDFLRLLLRAPLAAADEVVVACLRQVSSARGPGGGGVGRSVGGASHTSAPRTFLLQAGRFLATELGGDTRRLTTLLKALNT
ncbi:MAG: hypothetical protein FJ315_00930 [SAR202 cluster bacterium]|nr:hypothetical protein [SAR202 cluster bacterium]